MIKSKEEYNVVILSRVPVIIYPKINEKEERLLITYVAAGLPPNSLNIKKTDWTAAKEKELIRKDIETRLSQKAEMYKV